MYNIVKSIYWKYIDMFQNFSDTLYIQSQQLSTNQTKCC